MGIQLFEYETLGETEKLFVTSNLSFSNNVFKSCLLLMRQSEYLWSKTLKKIQQTVMFQTDQGFYILNT